MELNIELSEAIVNVDKELIIIIAAYEKNVIYNIHAKHYFVSDIKETEKHVDEMKEEIIKAKANLLRICIYHIPEIEKEINVAKTFCIGYNKT